MKRLVVFLGLMALALQGMAQVSGPPQHDPFAPDMLLGVNFSGSTNWPPESDNFYGTGLYYRYGSTPSPPFVITNRFQFEIVSPAMAQDAILLEKEEDGSFTTITNLNLTGGPDVYYFGQTWELTTNQIHSLVKGNWYAEVNFGDSNYFGNLTPRGWQGPFIGLPVAYGFGVHSLWGGYAISPDNRTAQVIFDGSNCEDEFYLPLQCVWSAQAVGSSIPFTVTNLMTTNTFSMGWHTGTLQMSDGVASSSPVDFYFEVITAGQSVDWVIAALPVDGIPSNNRRVMVKILSAAAAKFDRDRMAQGCDELETYERFVKASHLSNNITLELLQPVQDILDAFQTQRSFKKFLE